MFRKCFYKCFFAYLLIICSAVCGESGDFRTSASYLSLHADISARLDRLSTFAADVAHNLGRNIVRDSTGKVAPKRGCHTAERTHDAHSGQETPTFMVITEYQFGNTGNHFIELTHALWLSDRFNSTLVVPQYMAPILKSFDLAPLHAHFCMIQESEFKVIQETLKVRAKQDQNQAQGQGRINVLELESEESYWLLKILIGEQHKKRFPARSPLPLLSPGLIKDVSLHALYVASLFWSNISAHVLNEAVHLIYRRLHSQLNFVAVHKRSMEGGCSKVLNAETSSAEYDPHELPMDASEWKGALGLHHPLCEYPLSFVRKTMELFDHEEQATSKKEFTGINASSPIFLAWDGRGSVDDYRADGHAAISVDHTAAEKLNLTGDTLKLMDMFISMNSALFILNPRSTFSWQIYLIRTVLGLPSLPVMRSKDLYVERQSKYDIRKQQQADYISRLQIRGGAAATTSEVLSDVFDGRWVSWTSVHDAFQSFVARGTGSVTGKVVSSAAFKSGEKKTSHPTVISTPGRAHHARRLAGESRPFDLPVLPEHLPAPKDAPRLVNNRFVNHSCPYELWPLQKRIPRIIWSAVVSDSDDMPPHMLEFFERNKNWLPQVCDNACKDKFIDSVWANTSVQWAYHQLHSIAGPFKADLWRYAVLYTYGGAYIDDDSDVKTPFDFVVRASDTLIMSEEGAISFGPCYESTHKLSDPAFSSRFQKVLQDPNYDKAQTFFQGFSNITDGTGASDYLTGEERAAAAKRKDFIVPPEVGRTQQPIFFHGNTLINWCILSAPRHPIFRRTLEEAVSLIRADYLRQPSVHMAKWEPKHKLGLCTTTFVMTYTLREMLVDGSLSVTPTPQSSANTTVVNDSEWVPRISVRDFREYGGKCKAIWTGANPNHYTKKFKTHPHMLKSYAEPTSLLQSIEKLNNKAAMKNEGRDRGIYYISNATYVGPTPVADEAIIDTFSRHPFGDMDAISDYGYTSQEIKHVRYEVIDRLKEGVPVLSKAALKAKLKNLAN